MGFKCFERNINNDTPFYPAAKDYFMVQTNLHSFQKNDLVWTENMKPSANTGTFIT